MRKHQKPHQLTQDILDVLEKHMREKTVIVEAYETKTARSNSDKHITNSDRLRAAVAVRESESDAVLGITLYLPESLDKMGLTLPLLGDQMAHFQKLTREIYG